MCVVVVFVRPDCDVRLGHLASQQHHRPGGRGGVDLPDRHRWDCCRKCAASVLLKRQIPGKASRTHAPLCPPGVKGGEGAGLDLYDAESTRSRLLCVSNVQGEAFFNFFLFF